MKLIQAKDIDFYYVTTAAGVEEVVQIMGDHELYAIDTETYPLFDQYGDRASWRDPHTSRIRLIQVNVPNNNVPWVIDVLAVGREGLSPLIKQLQREDRRKVIHNCLPLDTWVLTKDSWKTITSIEPGDYVLGYKDGKQVWTKVLEYIDGGQQEVIETSNSRRKWRSTRNHRWLCEKKYGKGGKVYRDQYFNTEDLMGSWRGIRVKHSAPYHCVDPRPITPTEASILAWIWSDGNLSSVNKVNSYQCSITQSELNRDYAKTIENLLTTAGINFNKYPVSETVSRWNLSVPQIKEIYKKAGLNIKCPNYLDFILNISREALEAFCKSFWEAEGSKSRPYPQVFCQSRAVNSDKYELLMLAAHLLGYTPITDKRGKSVSFGKPNTSLRKLNHKSLGIQKVACLRTETSNFVIRQGDFITLTGNSTYDLKQFKGTFDVWLPNTWCTKVLMQRLGVCTGFKSSQARGHSLKSLSRDFFDIHLSKMEQTSDWSAPELRPEQLEYAALDVGAPKSSGIQSILLEGYDLILNTLIADPPEGFGVGLSLNLDQEANQVLARIEYTGMPINEAILAALMTTAKAELEDCRLKLCRDLDLPVEQKLTFEGGAPKLAIVVPDKVSKLLNNPKAMTERINEKLKTTLDLQLTDVQSSTLETILKRLQSDSAEEEGSEDEDLEESFFMEECRANIDLIDTLLTYKEKLKLTGTNYQALINPVTGCLHSAFNVIGASTGRMSSGGGKYTFNAQQLSKVSVKIDHLENPFESKSIIL